MTKKLRLCHRLSIPLGEQQYCYCQSYETLTAWLGSCRWASPMNQDTFATGIQRILSVRVIRMVLYVFNLMFVWGIWHCRLCLDVRTESHGLLSVLAPQTCYFSQVCDVRVVLGRCGELSRIDDQVIFPQNDVLSCRLFFFLQYVCLSQWY